MAKNSNRGSRGKDGRRGGDAAQRAAARSGSPARQAVAQREGLSDEAAELVGLLAQTFAELTDPLEVESMASAAMLPIAAEDGDRDLFTLGREVCRQLTERGDAAGLAALTAMHAVAPEGLAGALAGSIEKLTKRGVEAPAWSQHVGAGMRPVAAAMVQPGWWDDFVVVAVEFTYVGAPGTHTLLMVIDNNIGGVPVEMAIGPPLEEVLAEMTKPATTEPDSSPYESAELGLDEAAARLLEGLADFPDSEDITVDDFEVYAPMAENFRLFDSRARRMDANTGFTAREALGELEQGVLVDEYFRSDHVPGELIGVTWFEGLIRMAVSFMSNGTGGSALRWSPDLIAVFADEDLVNELQLETSDVESVVLALGGFSRFMIETGGLPDAALEQCLAAVEALGPALIAAIESPDDESDDESDDAPDDAAPEGAPTSPNAATPPGSASQNAAR